MVEIWTIEEISKVAAYVLEVTSGKNFTQDQVELTRTAINKDLSSFENKEALMREIDYLYEMSK